MGRENVRKPAFSATVRGRVQGVGFRYSVRSVAHRLGVAGYVQNLPDGTVRVECEGEPDAVKEMADWLRKGPPGAKVTALDVDYRPTKRGYTTFTIEH